MRKKNNVHVHEKETLKDEKNQNLIPNELKIKEWRSGKVTALSLP